MLGRRGALEVVWMTTTTTTAAAASKISCCGWKMEERMKGSC
jgi:hypothetical protein